MFNESIIITTAKIYYWQNGYLQEDFAKEDFALLLLL
jgi:hypothetical protein